MTQPKLTGKEQQEVMCEECAGGGSRWVRIPSTDPNPLIRACRDSGDGMGTWLRCEHCQGRGFMYIRPD